MKNQITIARKWALSTLTILITVLISFSSFAQFPGGGHPGGGHTGGGFPGFPGFPHPHDSFPGGGHPHDSIPGHHPHFTCNADFAFRRDTVVNGLRFFNLPGTGAATYAWDFGDGSSSTSANPSHTYADTGRYTVCLTITDTIGGGCTDTQCDTVHVFTPAPHCNAHFIARKDSIANGVRFHSGRFHGPNSTATYSWDFGDGNTSTDANPTNIYSAAGVYYVCLTVSNTTAGGTCSDTYCDSLNTDMPFGGHHPPHHLKLADPNSSSEVAISVYPNPMVESTTIHVQNSSGNVIFRVYNSTGQIAMTKTLGNGDFTISKENLSEGIYFYSVEDGNTNIAKGKLRVN